MNSIIKLTGLCLLSFMYPLHYSSAADYYYRTVASGSWNDPLIWQTAEDINFTVNLSNAFTPPEKSHRQIRIRSGHSVVITGSITIDEVLVEALGTLVYGDYVGCVLTISNGPGIDLQINGTFEDSGPANLFWETSQCSWALGENAVMIRTRSTSAALWRDHYENGMSTIPASSQWILRKQNADHPSLSGIGSFYGNLKIENTTSSFWNASTVGSKITGINSAPVIKGNLEIGTSGNNGVKFYNQNSASPSLFVKGDVHIGPGSIFHLEDAPSTAGASGIELQGNLLVDGMLSYDPSEANDQNRKIKFSGPTDQFLSGQGLLQLHNLSIDKLSGELILQRNISVDHKFFLENGKMNLNKKTLTFQNNATNAVERTYGWVQSETTDHTSRISWNIGNAAGEYEFPFGKNATTFIPVSVIVTSGNAGVVTVSTYGTGTDNLPLPELPEQVTNLNVHGSDNALHTVNRFWHLTSSGSSYSATLSFSYGLGEGLPEAGSLQARRYNSLSDHWEEPLCCQTSQNASRKVTVPGVQQFSHWVLMEESEALWMEKNSGKLNQQENITEFMVYPCPFSETLFLQTTGKNTTVSVQVFNSNGVKLFSENLSPENTMGLYSINFDDVPGKGFFYLQVVQGNLVKEVKVLRK